MKWRRGQLLWMLECWRRRWMRSQLWLWSRRMSCQRATAICHIFTANMEVVHQEDQERVERQRLEPEDATLTKVHRANAAECWRRWCHHSHGFLKTLANYCTKSRAATMSRKSRKTPILPSRSKNKGLLPPKILNRDKWLMYHLIVASPCSQKAREASMIKACLPPINSKIVWRFSMLISHKPKEQVPKV